MVSLLILSNFVLVLLDQVIWKVARSTSAAPFFFPEFEGKFLDGGLIANNPTSDLLTEIQQMKSSVDYRPVNF